MKEIREDKNVSLLSSSLLHRFAGPFVIVIRIMIIILAIRSISLSSSTSCPFPSFAQFEFYSSLIMWIRQKRTENLRQRIDASSSPEELLEDRERVFEDKK